MDDKLAEWIPSPNFNSRPGCRITMIVLHHTVTPTLEKTVEYFLTEESRVSSHYVLGRDGRLVQMVKDEDRAWHAGESSWKGVDNCNDYSIGVEIVNRGDGVEPFTEEQYVTLTRLLTVLVARYGIAKDMVVGHRDIALPPGRKIDPADNFNWERISAFANREEVERRAAELRVHYLESGNGARGQ